MKTQYGLALVLLLALAAAPAAGESIPAHPHEFYGTVTNGGSPAPAGTVIVAVIGGTECGSVTTTGSGEYGSAIRHKGTNLLVFGSAEQAGETIAFLVDGQTAQETATFTPGEMTRLDISATGGSTPTPTATPGSSNGGSGEAQGSTPTSAPTSSAPATPVGQASLSETGEVSETVTVRTADGAGSVTLGEGTLARDDLWRNGRRSAIRPPCR